MKYILFVVIFSPYFLFATDLLSELEAELSTKNPPVVYHFKSQYLINSVTTEMIAQKDLDFRITHRFGNILGPSGGPHTLWGFDQATNIRFSFDYGVNDWLQLGFGRSKTLEHLDFSAKLKFSQQKQKKMPVSAVYFLSSGFTPRKDTNEEYDFWYHRISYVHQLVLSSKINNISLGLSPSVSHRNIVINPSGVELKDKNTFFALGGMFRWKINPRVGIIGEYYHAFSAVRQQESFLNYSNPLAIGVEIETGGHVFHINLSNTAGIIANDFLPTSPESWLDKGFKLGFTISRNFTL